ncbi:MAG: diguanylate cyclase [Sulfurimonas sp.]|nr:diguanylate cyclase [Sulfurimonas sp.]
MHHNILNAIPYGIAKLSPKGEFLFVNKKLSTLKKTSKKEMLIHTIFDFCTQENVCELKKLFKDLNKGQHNNLSFEQRYKGIDLKIELTKDDNNNIVACFLDVSAEKILKQQVLEDQENLKRLDNAIKGANIGVWDFFPQEGRILANETWVTQKKYKDEDFREKSTLFYEVTDGLEKWASIVHPDDLEPTCALIEKHLNGETEIYEAEFRMICGDGEYRWIYDVGQVFQRDEEGKAIRMNGVHIDITHIKSLQKELEVKTEELKLLASLDPLTKLYNRRYFSETSEHIFKLAQRDTINLSVIMIDIDKFKTINDTYGHKNGDKVIVSFANVLKSITRNSDIICRYGGEEFLILLPSTDTKGATSMSQKINNRINMIMISTDNKMPLKFTVSMGISEVDLQKDKTIEEAIDRADIALYEAKNKGRNQVFIHDFLTTSKVC